MCDSDDSQTESSDSSSSGDESGDDDESEEETDMDSDEEECSYFKKVDEQRRKCDEQFMKRNKMKEIEEEKHRVKMNKIVEEKHRVKMKEIINHPIDNNAKEKVDPIETNNTMDKPAVIIDTMKEKIKKLEQEEQLHFEQFQNKVELFQIRKKHKRTQMLRKHKFLEKTSTYSKKLMKKRLQIETAMSIHSVLEDRHNTEIVQKHTKGIHSVPEDRQNTEIVQKHTKERQQMEERQKMEKQFEKEFKDINNSFQASIGVGNTKFENTIRTLIEKESTDINNYSTKYKQEMEELRENNRQEIHKMEQENEKQLIELRKSEQNTIDNYKKSEEKRIIDEVTKNATILSTQKKANVTAIIALKKSAQQQIDEVKKTLEGQIAELKAENISMNKEQEQGDVDAIKAMNKEQSEKIEQIEQENVVKLTIIKSKFVNKTTEINRNQTSQLTKIRLDSETSRVKLKNNLKKEVEDAQKDAAATKLKLENAHKITMTTMDTLSGVDRTALIIEHEKSVIALTTKHEKAAEELTDTHSKTMEYFKKLEQKKINDLTTTYTNSLVLLKKKYDADIKARKDAFVLFKQEQDTKLAEALAVVQSLSEAELKAIKEAERELENALLAYEKALKKALANAKERAKLYKERRALVAAIIQHQKEGELFENVLMQPRLSWTCQAGGVGLIPAYRGYIVDIDPGKMITKALTEAIAKATPLLSCLLAGEAEEEEEKETEGGSIRDDKGNVIWAPDKDFNDKYTTLGARTKAIAEKKRKMISAQKKMGGTSWYKEIKYFTEEGVEKITKEATEGKEGGTKWGVFVQDVFLGDKELAKKWLANKGREKAQKIVTKKAVEAANDTGGPLAGLGAGVLTITAFESEKAKTTSLEAVGTVYNGGKSFLKLSGGTAMKGGFHGMACGMIHTLVDTLLNKSDCNMEEAESRFYGEGQLFKSTSESRPNNEELFGMNNNSVGKNTVDTPDGAKPWQADGKTLAWMQNRMMLRAVRDRDPEMSMDERRVVGNVYVGGKMTQPGADADEKKDEKGMMALAYGFVKDGANLIKRTLRPFSNAGQVLMGRKIQSGGDKLDALKGIMNAFGAEMTVSGLLTNPVPYCPKGCSDNPYGLWLSRLNGLFPWLWNSWSSNSLTQRQNFQFDNFGYLFYIDLKGLKKHTPYYQAGNIAQIKGGEEDYGTQYTKSAIGRARINDRTMKKIYFDGALNSLSSIPRYKKGSNDDNYHRIAHSELSLQIRRKMAENASKNEPEANEQKSDTTTQELETELKKAINNSLKVDNEEAQVQRIINATNQQLSSTDIKEPEKFDGNPWYKLFYNTNVSGKGDTPLMFEHQRLYRQIWCDMLAKKWEKKKKPKIMKVVNVPKNETWWQRRKRQMKARWSGAKDRIASNLQMTQHSIWTRVLSQQAFDNLPLAPTRLTKKLNYKHFTVREEILNSDAVVRNLMPLCQKWENKDRIFKEEYKEIVQKISNISFKRDEREVALAKDNLTNANKNLTNVKATAEAAKVRRKTAADAAANKNYETAMSGETTKFETYNTNRTTEWKTAKNNENKKYNNSKGILEKEKNAENDRLIDIHSQETKNLATAQELERKKLGEVNVEALKVFDEKAKQDRADQETLHTAALVQVQADYDQKKAAMDTKYTNDLKHIDEDEQHRITYVTEVTERALKKNETENGENAQNVKRKELNEEVRLEKEEFRLQLEGEKSRREAALTTTKNTQNDTIVEQERNNTKTLQNMGRTIATSIKDETKTLADALKATRKAQNDNIKEQRQNNVKTVNVMKNTAEERVEVERMSHRDTLSARKSAQNVEIKRREIQLGNDITFIQEKSTYKQKQTFKQHQYEQNASHQAHRAQENKRSSEKISSILSDYEFQIEKHKLQFVTVESDEFSSVVDFASTNRQFITNRKQIQRHTINAMSVCFNRF